jgi:hypothetical protein
MIESQRPRRDDEAPEREPATEPVSEPAAVPEEKEPPETARRPAPGIEHAPEPDGENLIPAKDRPGTL